MLRTTLSAAVPRRSVVAARSLHASPVACKTVTEKVKEAAHNVNLKVGQTLAHGLEKGEEVTEKTQHMAGTAKSKAEETAGTAKTKANESGEVAKQKANQASAGATQAKEDLKKEMRK
ncbi:uncharacterized protein FOMMEDRAFT_19490 [Fomitiporia mediterranea MF3/22]|uniref:uncharacterized protein n=1 Tax=Fomitiporia mediterranea (strain MF3/22) TaxID=694068 RepID=UPI0004407690|nr:uncharacterized protein FOMMEDRAFT_19490 [Fomitiporia mediterranea MF3/22]EJD04230.1 hypothetical protein FOMMEDRAFT_19490 [Fomitiporia mediterranea MF3/22]